jgi:hypothetical protein
MTCMDALEEIKQLYYNTTRSTVTRDLIRAVTLLKAMPTEEERERAAVYMDGLSQMRSEWAQGGAPGSKGPKVQRSKGPRVQGSKGPGVQGSKGPRVQRATGSVSQSRSGKRRT